MSSEAVQLLDELEAFITEAAKGVLEGTEEDLAQFAQEMSDDMATALLLGDQEAVDDIINQSKALAAVAGIRANDAAWDTFSTLVGSTGNLVMLFIRIVNRVV